MLSAAAGAATIRFLRTNDPMNRFRFTSKKGMIAIKHPVDLSSGV
jgi:hypothetical protein